MRIFPSATSDIFILFLLLSHKKDTNTILKNNANEIGYLMCAVGIYSLFTFPYH